MRLWSLSPVWQTHGELMLLWYNNDKPSTDSTVLCNRACFARYASREVASYSINQVLVFTGLLFPRFLIIDTKRSLMTSSLLLNTANCSTLPPPSETPERSIWAETEPRLVWTRISDVSNLLFVPNWYVRSLVISVRVIPRGRTRIW